MQFACAALAQTLSSPKSMISQSPKLSIRVIFRFGWMPLPHLPRPQTLNPTTRAQIECLCRIALTIYGQKLLVECQGGQTGLTNRIFGQVRPDSANIISTGTLSSLTGLPLLQEAPRPAELLSPDAKRRFHGSGTTVWEKGDAVIRLPTPKVVCGTVPNNESTRDWIRQHPQCWKPSLPGARLYGTRLLKKRASESVVF